MFMALLRVMFEMLGSLLLLLVAALHSPASYLLGAAVVDATAGRLRRVSAT